MLVFIDKVNDGNISGLTKFEAGETSQVVSRLAFVLRIEEIFLVDVKLVVESIDVIILN